MRRSLDHRLIAGQVCLARQHIHDLGASDPRDKFKRECREPGPRDLTKRGLIAIGVHQRHDRRARPVAGEPFRTPDLEDQVGILQGHARP